jgi:DNA-directed RNA polymerase specialized sigma24 family protein
MPNDRFDKTSWTLVLRAGEQTPEGRAALSTLCKAYWFPVYAFVRRHAKTPDDALDHTQGFFAQLVARNDLAKLDRTRGSKFRAWVLTCVKHYLANLHKSEHAECRIPPELLDSREAAAAEGRYLAEPSDCLTPDRLYDRHFALSVLGRVREELRAKYAGAGKEALFDALEGCLAGSVGPRPYDDVAAALEKSEVAVRKAAWDLRKKHNQMLRAEVARLVNAESPEDPAVHEELRYFLDSLGDEPA